MCVFLSGRFLFAAFCTPTAHTYTVRRIHFMSNPIDYSQGIYDAKKLGTPRL